MKKLIIILICLFCGLSVEAKQLKFAQISDVNYSHSDFSQDEMGENYQVFDWLIRSLNINSPKFVVFLGDNVEKSREENVVGFLNKANSLLMPYYITVGNKDSHQISGLKKEDFWQIVQKNNKFNKKSEKTYYSFPINSKFIGIVLDGAVPFVQSNHGIFSDEQLTWLDEELKKNRKKKVLIFQHFPLIDPIEKSSYTMLYKEKYEAVIKKYDNIVLISSGHYDASKITVDEKGVYHISTPSINTPDYVYNLITIEYKKIPFRKLKIKDIKVDFIDLQ